MMPYPRRPPHSIFGLLLRWLERLLCALLTAITDSVIEPIAACTPQSLSSSRTTIKVSKR
jgi:hypothetical protein